MGRRTEVLVSVLPETARGIMTPTTAVVISKVHLGARRPFAICGSPRRKQRCRTCDRPLGKGYRGCMVCISGRFVRITAGS